VSFAVGLITASCFTKSSSGGLALCRLCWALLRKLLPMGWIGFVSFVVGLITASCLTKPSSVVLALSFVVGFITASCLTKPFSGGLDLCRLYLMVNLLLLSLLLCCWLMCIIVIALRGLKSPQTWHCNVFLPSVHPLFLLIIVIIDTCL